VVLKDQQAATPIEEGQGLTNQSVRLFCKVVLDEPDVVGLCSIAFGNLLSESLNTL